MRVAFPTNNQKTIANHIGLAKGFLIIDTDTNERFYIENPIMKLVKKEGIDLKNTEEGHRGLGTGRVIPPLLREAGVDVFVAREFGEGMLYNLQREGIIPYLTEEKNIETALNQFKEEDMRNLRRFDDFEEKGYGFGRGRCHGRGFGRGYGRGYGRGFGRGFGYGRRFGCRRWED